MEKKNDGGSAFPAIGSQNTTDGERYVFNEGMTLRDHFAGQAMVVMMPGALRPGNLHIHREDMAQFADLCYEMSDALLKAREQ